MENLWKVVGVLLVLWLIGLITGNTFGGLLHALLILAVVVAVMRLIKGKNPA